MSLSLKIKQLSSSPDFVALSYMSEGASGMDLRAELAALQAQTRVASGVALEDDEVTRIDAVRIAHLLAVHAPNLRPAPGLAQEGGRDSPQRIAGNDDMAVRRTLGQLEFLTGGGAEGAGQRKKQGG